MRRLKCMNVHTHNEYVVTKEENGNFILAKAGDNAATLLVPMPLFSENFTYNYGLKSLAYEMYKAQWMRRISIERQLKEYRDFFEACKELPELVWDDYISEQGYDGELYACFDEFLSCEYMDEMYMKGLLSPVMYEEYLSDVGAIKSGM